MPAKAELRKSLSPSDRPDRAISCRDRTALVSYRKRGTEISWPADWAEARQASTRICVFKAISGQCGSGYGPVPVFQNSGIVLFLGSGVTVRVLFHRYLSGMALHLDLYINRKVCLLDFKTDFRTVIGQHKVAHHNVPLCARDGERLLMLRFEAAIERSANPAKSISADNEIGTCASQSCVRGPLWASRMPSSTTTSLHIPTEISEAPEGLQLRFHANIFGKSSPEPRS